MSPHPRLEDLPPHLRALVQRGLDAQDVPDAKGPNQTERAFEAEFLVPWRAEGLVTWYAFEPVTLHLARRLRYTPDWWGIRPDGRTVAWEVKGPHEWEDARAKRLQAAETFPWLELWLARRAPVKAGGTWRVERMLPLGHVRG